MSLIKTYKFILNRIQLFGLRGVLTYPHTLATRLKKRLKFLLNAILHPTITTRGITVIADFSRSISLSKTMRDFVFALHDAGIPYQTYDTTPQKLRKVHLQDLGNVFTPPQNFRYAKFSHIISMFDGKFPTLGNKVKLNRIGFWEFESGFDIVYPEMCNGSPRIGMSNFNVEYFKKCTTDSSIVYKILYPFKLPSMNLIPPATVRQKYGFSVDDFIVFFNFDLGSAFHRKNPDGAMRAFSKALRDVNGAKLLFKIMRASQHPKEIDKLQKLSRILGIQDRFVIITEYLPEQEMYSLANACDVYISLHRGEGFGITVAEAMALGKPVIATDYSATTEFCNCTNSIPVPFNLIPPSPEQVSSNSYNMVKLWADPDLEFAAAALKDLYDHPEKRHKLGYAARQHIMNYFSIRNFKSSVNAFLDT